MIKAIRQVLKQTIVYPDFQNQTLAHLYDSMNTLCEQLCQGDYIKVAPEIWSVCLRQNVCVNILPFAFVFISNKVFP